MAKAKKNNVTPCAETCLKQTTVPLGEATTMPLVGNAYFDGADEINTQWYLKKLLVLLHNPSTESSTQLSILREIKSLCLPIPSKTEKLPSETVFMNPFKLSKN